MGFYCCLVFLVGPCYAPLTAQPKTPATSQPKHLTQKSKSHKRNKRKNKDKNAKKPQSATKALFKSSTLVSLFNKAQSLYKSQQYSKALVLYDRILKKYPQHEPTIIQIAKTLYRLDRIPEAYQFFSRINPVVLDTTTSYEYALTHFWMRKYDAALYGFKKIPPEHALSDLANYYGGISALKLGRLVEAEAMLRRAVVLPAKLAKSRDIYLKHIDQLNLLYQKHGLAQEREKEEKRIKNELNKTTESTHSSLKKDGPPQPAYQHSGFNSVVNAPSVGIIFKRQITDYHGFGTNNATTRIHYLTLQVGPMIPLPYILGKKQAALGIQFTAHAEDLKTSGVEQRNVLTDNLQDIQRIETKKLETSYDRFGEGSIALWIETPTTLDVWLSFGLEYSLRFPDFRRKDLTGRKGASWLMGSKLDNENYYSISLSYYDLFNNEQKKQLSEGRSSINWARSLKYSFNIAAQIFHNFYTYENQLLDGPSSVTGLSTDLSNDIGLGVRLGAELGLSYQSQFIKHGLPSFLTVSANAISSKGRFYLSASPISWLSLDLSQEIQKSQWTVSNSLAQETFEKNQGDYIETFQAQANLNYHF